MQLDMLLLMDWDMQTDSSSIIAMGLTTSIAAIMAQVHGYHGS